MGKYLDRLKRGASKAKDKIVEETTDPTFIDDKDFDENMPYDEDLKDELPYDDYDIDLKTAQRPESFHHFILENQYKDLEKSIRGYKEIKDKKTDKWIVVRKKEHCFTDEEAEEILSTAQSHLATDIKLGYTSKEAFPLLMQAIYDELSFLFERIAEYRYGRYNTFDKNTGKLLKVNYKKQGKMKVQNNKIFLELITRIQANYSRSIQGQENKLTHNSVKGQESLQNTESDLDDYGLKKMRYS